MCRLAIGPSQQYEGGEELFLDQEVCTQGSIICYYPGKRITGAEAEASSSKYIMSTQIGSNEWVYLDAEDKDCGYGRYADDSLYNGTENAEWRPVGRGKARRMALVATCTIKKGMPIRATYGWEYWYQPGDVPLALMRQAFIEYIDRIAWSPKRTKAWEFARTVGGEAALLEKWGGRRLHEEVPEEEQVSTSMDESSSDDAHDETIGATECNDATDQNERKRKRAAGVKTTDQTGITSATNAVTTSTVAAKRGHKRDSRRTSRRGSSLPIALKVRVGRPAPWHTDSSDDSSDIGVQIRPLALPIYRAGTSYSTRRQYLTGQHADKLCSRNKNTASSGHRGQDTESEHRADNTTQTCAEQRHLGDGSALQQESTVRPRVHTRRGRVDTCIEVGKLATDRSTTRLRQAQVVDTASLVSCGDEQDTQDQVRGSGQHRDNAKERMKNRQTRQTPLRPTETRTRGITSASLSSQADDVAISGIEPPLEEESRDDGVTTSRRVDDGVDNGRSSTTDIREWDAGTEQSMVQDTTARAHKTRLLRDRDVTAPDAEEADIARIDSSRCIYDDVISDSSRRVACTRTDGERTPEQGDAPGSR